MLALQTATAQHPDIHTTIDSTHIFIGQQTLLHVDIAANSNIPIQLPEVIDTLTTGVEVLSVSRIDTVDLGNNRIRMKYDYLVTSFDSAVYLLPPLRIIQGADTVYSEALALKVSTIPVDTESKQFYDIKGIAKPEFVLWDYLMLPLIIWFSLLILALLGVLIYRLIKKKPLLPFRKKEPDIPPHIRAIGKLDEIRLQKLWQHGKIKLYHSEITDTLRKYLEERFGIGAMEMTSGEILDAVKDIEEVHSSTDSLKQILVLADFVKFAKHSPLSDENETSLTNAYQFVEQTKKEEPEKQDAVSSIKK
jgi:hypothetical protein